jgi:tryptophan halogenase
MMGQGIKPQAYHPIAEKMRDEELERFLATIRDNVTRTVAALPGHSDYVARYCGAARAEAA